MIALRMVLFVVAAPLVAIAVAYGIAALVVAWRVWEMFAEFGV